MDKIRAYIWNNVINGDDTLRLNYDLNDNSVVFDVGGYHGDFADKIFNKFKCHVFIFEPVKEYYDIISDRFMDNDKITVYNFAFGSKKSEKEIVISDDSSSLFITEGEKELIKVEKISSFIKNKNIENIDLIKLNVEGSEYEILEDIFKNKIYDKILNIQVQFHDIDIDQKIKDYIFNMLTDHYNNVFKIEGLWEGWRNNKLPFIKNEFNFNSIISLFCDMKNTIDSIKKKNNELLENIKKNEHEYNLLKARTGTMISKIEHEINKFKAGGFI